jgi:hypothetical protein
MTLTENEQRILTRLEQDLAGGPYRPAGPVAGILTGGGVAVLGLFTDLLVVTVLGLVAIVTGVVAVVQERRIQAAPGSPGYGAARAGTSFSGVRSPSE